MAQETHADVAGLIDAYMRAWNASDLDGMGALYRPDIHWVNVKGMHWRGFEEVDRAHRIYFKLMFNGVPQTLEEIESVTSVAPDVSIAVVRWRMGQFHAPDGRVIPEGRTRMTLVMTRKADGWKIAHGANIDIDPVSAPFDPIRGAAK